MSQLFQHERHDPYGLSGYAVQVKYETRNDGYNDYNRAVNLQNALHDNAYSLWTACCAEQHSSRSAGTQNLHYHFSYTQRPFGCCQ